MKTVPLPFTGLRPAADNVERRANYEDRLAAHHATQRRIVTPYTFDNLPARMLTGTFIKVELKRGGPSKTARWLYDHAQAEQRYQTARGGDA